MYTDYCDIACFFKSVVEIPENEKTLSFWQKGLEIYVDGKLICENDSKKHNIVFVNRKSA